MQLFDSPSSYSYIASLSKQNSAFGNKEQMTTFPTNVSVDTAAKLTQYC